MKCARFAAVRASGLTLPQMEICADFGELTTEQRRIWLFDGVRAIGMALGEYDFHHDEDEDDFDDA